MSKIISYDMDPNMLRMVDGFRKVYEAVKESYGPRGGWAIIKGDHRFPNTTNDGNTIASSIERLVNRAEDIGAQLIRMVALKSQREVGDGTSLTVILAYNIFKEITGIINRGYNSRLVCERCVELIDDVIIPFIIDQSRIIEDEDDIKAVAKIASRDEKIAELVAESIATVGLDGVAAVTNGDKVESELEITNGFLFDGYCNLSSIYDVEVIGTVEYDNPLILMSLEPIVNALHIVKCLEFAAERKRPIIIIHTGISGNAKTTVISNHKKGSVKCIPIAAPGKGDRLVNLMKDISIFCGAELVEPQLGMTNEKIDPSYLGEVDKFLLNKNGSTLVGTKNQDAIDEQIKRLKILREYHALDPYDAEMYTERISGLAGGTAVIKIGGITEPEINEKMFRAKDGLAAAKSSMEHGICLGGGKTLLNSVIHLKNKGYEDQLDRLIVNALFKSFFDPINLLIKTICETDMDYQKMFQHIDKSEVSGINFNTGEFVDNLWDDNIFDSTEVIITAIQNAASIALTMARARVLIQETEKE